MNRFHKSYVILLLYVDGMVIIGASIYIEGINKIKREFSKEWVLRKLSERSCHHSWNFLRCSFENSRGEET